MNCFLLFRLFLTFLQVTSVLTINSHNLKTKQIATLGPSCYHYETLQKLHSAGASIFRINMSHNKKTSALKLLKKLQKLKKSSSPPPEILIDLQGPKYRVGKMSANTCLKTNEKVHVVSEEITGNSNRISIPHPNLFKLLQKDNTILLNDGLLKLRVDHCDKLSSIDATVVKGGSLTSHKGVNIPHLNIPNILTDKDKRDIEFVNMMSSTQNIDIDYVALSFVNDEHDITQLKFMLNDDIKILAKIERPQAVQNIDRIMQVSDGVMVARGDLGVEIGIEKVPFVQKLITSKKIDNKHVIVATQMMESMITNSIPTRAEVSDVANAVLDGATGVMLSAETSVGLYPVECVEIQRAIMSEAEQFLNNV